MYHRIAEDSFDPWGLAVSPANFAEQLRWLSGNRTVFPLREFAARHRDGSLPDRAVALTFDDGYACAAEVAAPLMNQFGIPATIFLPVELIERGDPFWWDELERLVLDFHGEALRLDDVQIPIGERQAGDRTWKPGASPRTARQVTFQRLWSLLRPKPPAELDRSMAELRSQGSTGRQVHAVPMTRSQVRALGAGFECGSHALTHPFLTSLESSQKSWEIEESMGRCEALVGHRPSAFAYPYGDFDDESERLVQKAGFTCACATISSAVTPRSRPFALPRIQVGDWNAKILARALSAAPN